MRTQGRIRTSFVLAAISAGAVASSMIPAQAASLISERKPNAFVLSTDNVYFTSNEGTTASVWRTGQNAKPGQEILLYSETNARFEDIAIAQVDGIWFAYFLAAKWYPPQPILTKAIKRVPLDGGPATIIKSGIVQVISPGGRNLITDGAYLYWQDRTSVRKLPICRESVVDPTAENRSAAPAFTLCGDTVLDATDNNGAVAGLALRGTNLIYANRNDIRYVPTTGSAITTPVVRTIAKGAGPSDGALCRVQRRVLG